MRRRGFAGRGIQANVERSGATTTGAVSRLRLSARASLSRKRLKAAEGDAQAHHPRLQLRLLLPVQALGLFQAHPHERYFLPRPQLAQVVEVGTDDLADLGVA